MYATPAWTIAQTHLQPMVTVPVAVLLGVACVYYWIRLGHPETPSPRRRIRRFSLGVVLIELAFLVAASSVIDPELNPARYVITWTIAMFLLIGLVILALLDYITTVRLHVAAMSEEIEEESVRIRAAMDAARRNGGEAE